MFKAAGYGFLAAVQVLSLDHGTDSFRGKMK